MAHCINIAEEMDGKAIGEYGKRAKQRIADEYTWKAIADKYENLFIYGFR